MSPQARRQIFKTLKANNPKPKTELVYSSHFELLVSVILSAQATDISVNKATLPLFKVANTPESLLALGYDRLCHYIKSIGLYRNKAKHIIAMCQTLIEKHQSKVPDTRQALEALAGVGRKTANVILNTAFGQPTMAVDTHIFRIANRTGLAPEATPRAVEDRLIATIPKEFLQDAHHWLILHGRYTCTARAPKCQACSIVQWCQYPDKT